MVTKGVIKEVRGHKAVVSIPALGQSDMNLNIDRSSLPVAQVMGQPGVTYVYEVGDVVYIALEDDNIFKPVILGVLPGASSSMSDSIVGELSVKVSAELPSETTVGGVNLTELMSSLSTSLYELSETCNNLLSKEEQA